MTDSIPATAARLPWWTRVVQALNALDRLVLRLPCNICGDRRRCWRWHVEVFDCPTCGAEIDEFHPRFPSVIVRLQPQPPWSYVLGTTTYTNAATATLTWRQS